MGVTFDFSELKELAADFEAVPDGLPSNVTKALKVTATRIKKDWSKQANRTGLAGYAAGVTYDIEPDGADAVVAEIGPEHERNQGQLGLVEEANGGVRSAPQHAGRDALKANEADFERGMELALIDSLKVVER